MDRVTKVLLSVVATCLVWICAQSILAPRSAGAGAPPRAAARRPAPPVIRAQRFVLEDADGNFRASLSLTEGGAMLLLVHSRGKQRAVLGTADEGPGLTLWDAKGTGGAAFVVLKTGPILALRDEEGRTRANLSATEHGTALSLHDGLGQLRGRLAVEKDGPVLEFRDAKGATSRRLR